jgi:hypothetical protein
VERLRLWLLDADVIIDLPGLDVFDKLVKIHQVSVASTVVEEIQHFWRAGEKILVDFRGEYIEASVLREVGVSTEELQEVIERLPALKRDVIHAGELESLAILLQEEDLTFCSCDAATIRTLPFLDLDERGISTESLLRKSGLLKPGLKDRHAEEYFRNNLRIGQQERMLSFES